MDKRREELDVLRANVDQAMKAIGEIARMLGAYRKELLEQGFGEEQILHLCLQHYAHMMSKVQERDD